MPALAALLLAAAGAQAQAAFGTVALGSSATQTVTVTSPAGGAVSSVEVLTAGAPNLDFTANITGTSCGTPTLSPGDSCQQSVTFAPLAPGVRIGAVVLLDGSNNVLGTAYLSGIGSGGLGVLSPGNLIPVAGQEDTYEGPVVNGIPATQGLLDQPSSVVLDGAGNMYIADSNHHMIRMVCAGAAGATIYGTAAACTGAGIITTIAGTGDTGYTGDTKSSLLATLDTPWGVALDGAGNLYIADTNNNAVRMITAATGIITTVAGNAGKSICPGHTDIYGDGCLATSAILNQPRGVTIDSSGNLFIADTFDNLIRRVDAVTGVITAVAGNGAGGYLGDTGPAGSAELNLPFAVAFDSKGNMYIPDSLNNVVRLVTAVGGVISGSNTITRFAGSAAGTAGYSGDGTPAASATLDAPSGVIVDPAGNVYISDTQNSAIRKVYSSASSTPGYINTVVANALGQNYYNGAFAPISIYGPVGIFLDNSANLYFADKLNMVIQELQSNYVALDYLPGGLIRQGSVSAAINQTVENDGNASFDLSIVNLVLNAALGTAETCTRTGEYLAVDADCIVAAEFAPSPSIPPTNPEFGTIDVGKTGDTVDAPLDIELVGKASLVNSTTTTLTSSVNPSVYGALPATTFTATVTTGSGTGNLTGTVSFFDGATTLRANVALNAPPGITATATYVTADTTLAVGQHSITATYNVTADPNHFSSTSSPALLQTVNEFTATALASSANPSVLGANVTFTATITTPDGGGVAPDDTVTFTDGANILATQPVTAGVATLTTNALPQGLNPITATYNGDSSKYILGSASAVLNQEVLAASTTGIVSSLNPSNYGQLVTFTVTVTPGVAAYPPTGVVNILDGGVLIAPLALATVGITGQATYATAALTAGTHNITAAYQGDTYNSTSTSTPVLAQVVNKTTPTITWPPPAAITYGTLLSAAQLDAASGGVAGAFVYTPASGALLDAGAQTLSVKFTPTDTADYNTITVTVPLTVNPATLTMVLTTSNATVVYGATVTFTATISAAPTGDAPVPVVTFDRDGPNPMGAGALVGNVATFAIATLPVGAHSITAAWPGNNNYNPATAVAIVETITQATPVITWATPVPITYGTPLSATPLDAATTIGGAFVYTPAAGAVPGAGQQILSVTFTPTDTTDYTTATATVTLTVNKATPSLTWPPPAAITYGTALGAAQLDAASGGVAGAFTYTPPAGTVEAAGVQTLSVLFTPTDATDYNTATDSVSLTVNKATPTLTLTTSGTPSNYGATVTFTATSSAGPTGTVTFYDGGNQIGAGTLAANAATLQISTLAVGSHTITASWPGNGNFLSDASNPVTQVVVIADTATTVVAVPNPAIAGAAVAITATVKVASGGGTPTGNVVFTNGAATMGSANLTAAGTATMNPVLGPGQYNILAAYSGDANDNGSASAPAYVLTVNLATTQTTITGANPNPSQYLIPVTFTAVVTGNGGTPAGPVTFLADGVAMGPAVNVDGTGTATFIYAGLAAGSHQITASYGGDTNDSPSLSVAITQVVIVIPTLTYLGSSTTTGSNSQVILVASVLNNSNNTSLPTPTGTVTFNNGATVLDSAPLDATGVATLVPNLSPGTYTVTAYYSGDLDHGTSTSQSIQITVPGHGLRSQRDSVRRDSGHNAEHHDYRHAHLGGRLWRYHRVGLRVVARGSNLPLLQRQRRSHRQ